MNSRHFWFRSGNYSLLGHLDRSGQKRGPAGVVIVPPFGWEDVCAYRPLRFMAKAFARMGLPTLRYDLPGTGDSSGSATDPALFESWIQSVSSAADELQSATGVSEVAVVGIHLGAMLAMTAATREANIRQLVLWGPAARGRTILRELRAFANVERREYLPEQDAPPQPVAGFGAGGFLLAPETLRALEDLDISALPWAWRGRILFLSRDDLPHDGQLVDALRAHSEASVEVATGRGYSAMTATPQESLFPEDTCRLIADFLMRNCRQARDEVSNKSAPRASISFHSPSPGQPIRESVYGIQPSYLGMFGILTEPEPGLPRSDFCVLYLNAGGVRHTGPNRMWVESARRWAAQGVTSLRFDLRGIGESDGEPYIDVPGLYKVRLMDQIEAAIDSVRQTGVNRFIAIGLCSGACWAFHAAARNPDVHAAILVNPSLLYWDPGADRRRILTGWAEWVRMIQGGIQRGDIRRGVRRIAETFSRTCTGAEAYLQLGFQTMSHAWCSLEQSQKRVTLVFREGEPLLDEMTASGQLPPETNSLARCIRVPNGGHTLRPLWAQKLVHDIIDAELSATVHATFVPDETCRAMGARK
jgi:pimeloyl-ACP methyl ester carboxylesterase